MKLFLTVLLSAALLPAQIRLIVQGDDMGAAHAINAGTIEAYEKGILRSTNVILAAPWVNEAAALLQAHPDLEVGVHLALTSEWTNVKWRPLTHAPSLLWEHNFPPAVTPRAGLPAAASLKAMDPSDAEVERELRAQIELAKQLIPRVSYLSGHMGFEALKPEWRALVTRLGHEYGLRVEGPDDGVGRLSGVWTNTDPASVRAEKLAARLEKLEPGTYRFLDHCALDTPEMRAISHPGYENVAQDRAAVVAAWTSPKVLEVIRRRHIQLIGNADAIPLR